MNYIALFLILGVAVCIHGRKLPDPTWAIEVKADDDACKGKLFTCANCTYTRVCRPEENGDLVHYEDNLCPTERPYCDPNSGTCVSEEPMECGQTDDSFVCLQRNQYFPAPDCHQFHYCDEKYVPKLFNCTVQDYVFNPTTENCDKDTPCMTYPCLEPAKKVQHQHFEKFYAMCGQEQSNDMYDPVVLNVCPDYFSLNATSQKCEPNCQDYFHLNIPDPTDCHYYYHCIQTFLTETQSIPSVERLSCPANQAYDPEQFICVDEKTVPACKKS